MKFNKESLQKQFKLIYYKDKIMFKLMLIS